MRTSRLLDRVTRNHAISTAFVIMMVVYFVSVTIWKACS